MTNSICGVVVLYHPGEEVFENIATYAGTLDKLYIVDNSEDVEAFETGLLPCDYELLSSGENLGIDAALNLALRRASGAGYRWMLTMDQDGSFESGQLQHLLECLSGCHFEKALLIAPVHHRRFSQAGDKCLCGDTQVVMTSGNLVNVSNAVAIGGYSTSFFIDEVDHEFCLRGKSMGYEVVSLFSAFVNHQLGRTVQRRGKTVRLYPPERLYYMLRNYLYLRQTYVKRFPAFFHQRSRFLVRFFLQHLRFSQDRFACLGMLARGWCDYTMKRKGRLDG